MAWIVPVPPSPRHPRKRWKVVYRDEARRERSAGIYPAEAAARAVKRILPVFGEVRFTDLDADHIGDR